MINVSNSTSKNNPPWLLAEPFRPTRPAGPPQPGQPGAAARTAARTAPARPARNLVTAVGVLLGWLATIPRRLGDRMFVMNDTEAYWRSWQITRTRAGLARRYRDPQFGALAECPSCRGAGGTVNLPCAPCAGSGRVTLGEVS